MKTLLIQILSLLLLINTACTSKKENHDDGAHMHTDSTAADDTWAEMDEFHTLMAEAFHPYKDSANLEPAKATAIEMTESAQKWLDAPLPEKVDNENIKSKLQQLQKETAEFSRIVSTADDKTIGESLTKLHDLFHELQEAWYSGSGEHKEHH